MAFGFSVGERVFDRLRPVERLVLRVIVDEAGCRADFALDADIRLIGVGLIESVAEPIGH